MPCLSGNETRLSEVLEVIGGPLEEYDLWAILLKCVEALSWTLPRIQPESSLSLSPSTLILCGNGKTRFVPEEDDECDARFLAPECVHDDVHDVKRTRMLISEKGCCYSLGMTLFFAAEYECEDNMSLCISTELSRIVMDMCETDMQLRPTFTQLLEICKIQISSLRAAKAIRDLVESILGNDVFMYNEHENKLKLPMLDLALEQLVPVHSSQDDKHLSPIRSLSPVRDEDNDGNKSNRLSKKRKWESTRTLPRDEIIFPSDESTTDASSLFRFHSSNTLNATTPKSNSTFKYRNNNNSNNNLKILPPKSALTGGSLRHINRAASDGAVSSMYSQYSSGLSLAEGSYVLENREHSQLSLDYSESNLSEEQEGALRRLPENEHERGPEFVRIIEDPSLSTVELTPSLFESKFKDLRKIHVMHINKQKMLLHVKVASVAKDVFDQVVSYIGLKETIYFGLTHIQDGEHVFVELEQKLTKFAPKGWKSKGSNSKDFVFHFRVKFFVNNLKVLRQPLAIHLVYLELRHHFIQGQLSCGNDKVFQLAALALQAEYNDMKTDEYRMEYFKPSYYLPQKVLNSHAEKSIRGTLVMLHHSHRHMPRDDAEKAYIMQCQSLCQYGSLLYRVAKSKDVLNDRVVLGLSISNIKIFQENSDGLQLIHSLQWEKIRQFSFRKKKFIVMTQGVSNTDKMVFYTSHYRRSKYLLKLCQSFHRFRVFNQARLLHLDKQLIKSTVKDKMSPQSKSQQISRSPLSNYNVASEKQKTKSILTESEHIHHTDKEEKLNRHQHSTLLSSDEEYDLQTIVLTKKPGQGLGIVIVGGEDIKGLRGTILVSEVIERGIAHRDGRLRKGDCLLSVNGKSLEGVTHDEAIDILQNIEQRAEITIVPAKHLKRWQSKYRTVSDGRNAHSIQANVQKEETITGWVVHVQSSYNRHLGADPKEDGVHVIDSYDHDHHVTKETTPGHPQNNKDNAVPKDHTDHKDMVLPAIPLRSRHSQLSRQPHPSAPLSDVPQERVTGHSHADADLDTAASSDLHIVMPKTNDCESDSLDDVDRKEVGLARSFYIDSSSDSSRVNSPDIYTVMLEKCNGTFGIKLTGGVDSHSPGGGLFVISLLPDGPAERCGQIKCGDQLMEVNGISLANITHKKAVAVLKHSPSTTSLSLKRLATKFQSDDAVQHPSGQTLDSPVSHTPGKCDPVAKDDVVDNKPEETLHDGISSAVDQADNYVTLEVSLTKENGRLGLSLFETAGGTYVREIVDEPAVSCGLFVPGDWIIAVNDCDVSSMPHGDIIAMLQGCASDVTITVKRKAFMHPNKGVSQLQKDCVMIFADCCGRYGFDIVEVDKAIVVNKMHPKGPAARSGYFRQGQHIKSINGIDTLELNVTTANQLISRSHPFIQLQIEPAENLTTGSSDEASSGKLLHLNSMSLCKRVDAMCREHSADSASTNSEQNATNDEGTEILVTLKKESGSLGMTLMQCEGATIKGVFIRELLDGGAAQKCNALLPKDKVISVNGVDVQTHSKSELITLLRSIDDTVTLQVFRPSRREPEQLEILQSHKEMKKVALIQACSVETLSEDYGTTSALTEDGDVDSLYDSLSDCEQSFDSQTHHQSVPSIVQKIPLVKQPSFPHKQYYPAQRLNKLPLLSPIASEDCSTKSPDSLLASINQNEASSQSNTPATISEDSLMNDGSTELQNDELPEMNSPESLISNGNSDYLFCKSDLPDSLSLRWIQDTLKAFQLKMDSSDYLAELQRLKSQKATDDCGVGRRSFNEKKNRFKGILPYDSSRVVLNGGEEDDYINASHVKLEIGGTSRHYIATQNPLSNTTDDFWRMLWETKSELIIALENPGKFPCYWPETADKPLVIHDRFVLRLLEEDKGPSLTHRKFSMTNRKVDTKLIIRQIAVCHWPDSGIPKDPVLLLQLLSSVQRMGCSSPWVVHCSSGISRTGLFMAMEAVLTAFVQEQQVDLFQLIAELKKQRKGIVQTREQYRICHLATIALLENMAATIQSE